MAAAFMIVLAGFLSAGNDTSYIVTLRVGDALGHSRILRIGLHPEATYGYDTLFQEIPIPPAPVVPVFDARLLDLPKRPRFPGTGTKIDIRALLTAAQSDTFIVKFQPAEGKYPLTISWPSDIDKHFKRATMEYRAAGEKREIDMSVMATFTVFDDAITGVVVILSGPRGEQK